MEPPPLKRAAAELGVEVLQPEAVKSGEFRALLAACAVVLVSDYAKGMVDRRLMDLLRASGKPIVVDPRPQHTDLYAGVSLVTPNRKEATEMLACLRACNFALLPSLVENFSMAGLECLHYGIPVVAFDTGGNSELIRDGVSGHVVPYLDMEAFVAKAGFLLDAAYLSKMRGLTLADAKRRLGDEVLVPRLLAALGIV